MASHKKQPACFLNGSFLSPSRAKVSIFDRAFLFGDAIYEVIRVHRGLPFRLKDHYARMSNGLTALRIPVPFTEPEFGALCSELIRRNGLKSGTIYFEVTRGAAAARHHAPSAGMSPTVVAFTHSARFPAWKKHGAGVSAVTVADTRWSRCNLKTTMLLANTLAKTEAEEAGVYEAILVADDGAVREGSSTSIFAVADGTLRTHPADSHILPSVTRKLVLELARADGIPVSEKAVTLRELRRAREIFLASTTNDVCPIIKLDGRAVGSGKAGPVTSRLMKLVAETIERECVAQEGARTARR